MIPPAKPPPIDTARIKGNVQKMIDAGAPDEDIHGYLQSEGLSPVSGGTQPTTTPVRRAPLPGGQPTVDASSDEDTGYAGRLATHVLNAAQGIPGVEAIEAGAGVVGSHLPGNSPLSYHQSLATLRGMTGNIGGKTSAAEKMLGSVATLPFLPASPGRAGALLGGASQALSADDNQSLLERGTRTAAGSVVGKIAGNVLDKVTPLVRLGVGNVASKLGINKLAIPTAAANLLSRQEARSATSGPLYDLARAQGGGTPWPPLQDFVNKPNVKPLIDGILETEQFQGKKATDPEVLDQLYKTFSDQMKIAKKGLMAVDPRKPNLGNLTVQNIGRLQSDLMDLMSGSSTTPAPAPMPAYRDAVNSFGTQSRVIDALKRGYQTSKAVSSPSSASVNNLTRLTPEALDKWASSATPDELQAAREGIFGNLKGSPKVTIKKGIFPAPSRTLSTTPDLLRIVDPNNIESQVAKSGLLALKSGAGQ